MTENKPWAAYLRGSAITLGRTTACGPARQNVARGNRHARAYRNAHVDQNKVPNNLLVNEPSLSTHGIGGSCGR
jgi:hypothetical protein